MNIKSFLVVTLLLSLVLSLPLLASARTSFPEGTASVSSVVASANNDPPQYLVYAAGAAVVLVILGVFAYAISRRSRRTTLPKHSYQQMPPSPPNIDLTPKQAPVQQIVIKEVAMVNCKYCGTLIESTAQVCPRCGAPRT